MTDKQFVLSVEPEAFAEASSLSGNRVIYEDNLQFHKLSEYWPMETQAWADAAERLRKRFLAKLES